jgi:hypothetical protein
MTGPDFGMVPRRVAKLHLPGRVLNVLIAITAHTYGDRRAVSLDQIATDAAIDRSKVPACVRRLKAEGILTAERGGGAGRATIYRIIRDDEAAPPNTTAETTASSSGKHAIDTKNVAHIGNEIAADEAENVATLGSKTLPPLALNGTADGNSIDTRNGTESPLRGERAREVGGSRSRSVSVERQPALLLPLKGRRCTTGPLENYRPGPEIVAWARQYTPGIDPLDQFILGRCKDYYLSRGINITDPEATYRNWLREELERRSGRRNEARAVTGLATVLAMIGDG